MLTTGASQVLMCMVCAALGIWVGWLWGVSCPRRTINLIVPAPMADYNHSQLLLTHLQPSVIKEYMRWVGGEVTVHGLVVGCGKQSG